MIIKASLFAGGEGEPQVIPLGLPQERVLEKTGSALLPEVRRYISDLRPRANAQYVLVNALGAGEFYGSNVNGDYFSEASLIHVPQGWTGDPLVDKVLSGKWPYGYPTFYRAKPFIHHRNKSHHPHFGEVELAAWNPRMRRVELVIRLDRELCEKFGAISVWDKIKAGGYPDVSMGCFTAGTLVTLADGSRKPIEEISVGDEVLTHLGRSRKVTELHRRRYQGELFSIKAEATRVIRTTSQHPFFVTDAQQTKAKDQKGNLRWTNPLRLTPSWVEAQNLELSNQCLFPIPTTVGEGVSREQARLLGYYLAEGHILRNRKKEPCGVELTTHREDAVHEELDGLCTIFGTRNAPVYFQRSNSEKAVGVSIFDASLAAFCLENAGSYSASKKLSAAVMSWPVALQLELLGAYANGDGCAGQDGSLSFSTASSSLAWQVQLILARAGIPASVQCLHHQPSGLVTRETEEFVVHVGKQYAQRLRGVTAKVRPAEILREKNSRVLGASEEASYLVTPIREITSLYVETEVYNLEVEEDNSFLVEGLAVHNCRVPWDLCSICTDWDLYRKALATHDPRRWKSPGEAVLHYHKNVKHIRGLAVTRKDYCEHASNKMNEILPGGRKVFVYNEFPDFFDISFVFIGADRTAKTLLKIAENQQVLLEESLEESPSKVASLDGLLLKTAARKESEIVKDILPQEFARKAVPLLSDRENDLPDHVLDGLADHPLSDSLGTAASLGVVLRPREFQRVVLIRLGNRDMADHLDRTGVTFGTPDGAPSGVSIRPVLLRQLLPLLLPLLSERSAFGPYIEPRAIMLPGRPSREKRASRVLEDPLLAKIASAYVDYRDAIQGVVAFSQTLLHDPDVPSSLRKLASIPIEEMFTPLSATYLKDSFGDAYRVRGS